MTTATITAHLPNGFHDAVLRELHVEFGATPAPGATVKMPGGHRLLTHV